MKHRSSNSADVSNDGGRYGVQLTSTRTRPSLFSYLLPAGPPPSASTAACLAGGLFGEGRPSLIASASATAPGRPFSCRWRISLACPENIKHRYQAKSAVINRITRTVPVKKHIPQAVHDRIAKRNQPLRTPSPRLEQMVVPLEIAWRSPPFFSQTV